MRHRQAASFFSGSAKGSTANGSPSSRLARALLVPGSQSKRTLFPGAASYTGLDLYPDENTA